MTALLRVMRVWRGSAGPLLAGGLVSLLSVGALAGLALTAGAVTAPQAAAGVAGAVLLWQLRALGIARVVLRYLERLVTHRATFSALAALRVWLFRGLAGRSAGGLGMMRSGDALARLVGDVEALDGLYLRIAIPAVSIVLLLPVLVLVLGSYSAGLALLVGLLFLLAAVLVPMAAARGAVAMGGRLATAGAALRIAALDALGGMREVRAFGAEGRMLASVQAREAALLHAQRILARRASLAQAAAFLCGQAALLSVLLAPGMPSGLLLPAVLLTLAAFEAAAALPRAGVLAGHAAAAAGRIVAAAEGPSPLPGVVAPAPLPRGTGLRFDSVRFAWPGRAAVLDGVSLDIPAGSRVALLGPSGAGKSTLAALMLKVVAPQEGRVLLGGTDLALLRAEDVRSRIAWLGQDTHLFSDTIRANLLLGRPDAGDGALWIALEQAGVAGVVRGLPDGLDTWIGAGGAGLSGGQGRRVALARALLSEAPILLLDEPATGLDAAAERAFLMTLNDVAPGRTVVLIVHRLMGVERVDRIWRLSAGHLVAAAA